MQLSYKLPLITLGATPQNGSANPIYIVRYETINSTQLRYK